MPGLIIILSKKKQRDEKLLSAMADSLQHEEFHQKMLYDTPPFGVARVHLGTFNPESQPIFNEDRSLCVFMDGKIYGHEKEMDVLKKTHTFTTGNDPEFCLHSYEESGTNFVKNLNGSFLLVLLNIKEEKALILTDRYGHRPLYYREDEDKIVFASEVKAFLKDKKFKKLLDEEGIADFFVFGEIFGNKTLFKEIKVLPPACIFSYEKGTSSVKTYWDFHYAPDYKKKEAAFARELASTFKKAVEIRVRDNVKYGLSLSGGLDSRSIAAVLGKKNVIAFTFGHRSCEDVKIARKVAQKVGIPHETVEIDAEKLFSKDTMRKLIDITGGMEIISLSFLLYVYERMKSSVEVVFQGLSADLLLGATFLHPKVEKTTTDEELAGILCEQFCTFSLPEIKELFNPPYDGLADIALESLKENLTKCKEDDARNTSDHFLLLNYVRKFYFVGELLITNYVEEAMPSYDNDFIELIMTIPPELRRYHRVYSKYLKTMSRELARITYNQTMMRADAPPVLWKVARKYLFYKNRALGILQRIVKRPLLNVSTSYIDYAEGFRSSVWKNFITETLLSEKVEKRGIFRKEYIEKIVTAHMNRKRDYSKKITYLLTFELFLRAFFDEE